MVYDSGIDALLQFDLTEIIEAMMSYVDLIDSSYHEKTNNKIMRYWQAKDVTLKLVFLTDLLDWLCCLAFSDGFIAPEEVQFINMHLKQNFSVDDIIDLCKFRINEDYFNHLPLSFILLYEDDLIMKNMGIGDFSSVENLYMLYMVIGVHFIHCDNDVAFKELAMLNGYTEDLSKRISDFNLIQDYLAILEASNGEVGEKYSENRYPFNQEFYNDYQEELSELKSLEDINEEIQQNNSYTDINFNPWDFKHNDNQNNYWQPREVKTSFSWNLEKNINNYYDFTGEFDNHLADIGDIITVENRQRLENVHLTPQQYRSILNKIKSTSDSLLYKIFNENYNDFNSLNTFERIVLFTKSFVDADYKSSGVELGVYSFNKIHLDDRYDSVFQITTLIHELSHHLLAEIFEQAAMILLNTDKTDALEWYVNISLGSSMRFALLNEYCAHKVEGHFTPQEYQHYSSFLKILEEFDLNKDKQIILECMMLGNAFSQDILSIIEPFIDNNNLSEEIKQEFKKNLSDLPNSDGFLSEFGVTSDINHLLDYINIVLLTGLDEALKNTEA